MIEDKQAYNENSSHKYGWEPEWLGCSYFDEDLEAAIEQFQADHDLEPDGLLGPTTFRRLWTERNADKSWAWGDDPPHKVDFIICNNNKIRLDWDKVVLWDMPQGLSQNKGTYKDCGGQADRDVSMFVNHWDVCLSSAACNKVLNKRGISVHFSIDNDGTIYQHMDTQHVGWHAGSRRINELSIGVEISNAYYPKYQKHYKKRGFGERPMMEDVEVHGKTLRPFLGFYDVQLDALVALWRAINVYYGVPLNTPTQPNGDAVSTVVPECASGAYEGYVSHYHLKRKKIDCAGLDIPYLLCLV